jgi:DNA-binding transcriptional LysR family regulator
MNLRQLRALNVLMEDGTVTSAARHLGVTQPAASRMLLQLEEEVGFPLFRRQRGRLLPTPEGQLFHREAYKVLSNFDHLTALSRDIAKLQGGYLRVVAMQTFAYTVLPPAVAHFSRQHPGVTLEIQVRQRSEIADIIAKQNYDIAFTSMPDFAGLTAVEPLMVARAVCILPRGHSLAKKSVIHVEDLEHETLVMGENWVRTELLKFFSEAGMTFPRQVTAETATMVCELVATGLGVAAIHPYMARRFRDHVIARPLAHKINMGFFVLFPDHGTDAMLPRRFIEAVQLGVEQFAEDSDAATRDAPRRPTSRKQRARSRARSEPVSTERGR